MRDDGDVHFGGTLQPFGCFTLQRSGVRHAPTSPAGFCVVDDILQRLVGTIGPRIGEPGIGEKIHHRIQVAVSVGGLAEQRGQNIGRRRGVKNTAIGFAGSDARNSLGAGATFVILHDEIRVDVFVQIFRQFAQEDVAPAARARMRDQGDELLRIRDGRVGLGRGSRNSGNRPRHHETRRENEATHRLPLSPRLKLKHAASVFRICPF